MTVLPNTDLTSFFEKLKEKKSEIKKFLIKAPTAFLPPVFKDIVRDAIEAFYPSKEEQLIKELEELTEDGFEELRGMLELDNFEFKTLLSLLDSSIEILHEDHQRIMKGIEEILERLKIGYEMSFKGERDYLLRFVINSIT